MTESIVGSEALFRGVRQYDSRAGHPVRFFAVYEMPNDVEWTERLRPFIPSNERLGHPVEECAQRRGGPTQNVCRAIEIEGHPRATASQRVASMLSTGRCVRCAPCSQRRAASRPNDRKLRD